MIMPIAIAGAAGRMGAALIEAVRANPQTRLIAAFDLINADQRADPDCRLTTPSDLPLKTAKTRPALIDFSAPRAAPAFARLAAQTNAVYICGTTGLNTQETRAVQNAAKKTTVIQDANMSMGIAVLRNLVREAAQKLDWDIEILEMHHNRKKDAPSGTALLLGKSAAEGRRQKRPQTRKETRQNSKEIGFASLRGGTTAGDHDVILAGAGERIILSHRAESRAIFAQGALKAALWGRKKKRGLFTMTDALADT